MPRVVKSSLLRLAVLTAALSVFVGIGHADATAATAHRAACAAAATAQAGSATDDWNNTGACVPPPVMDRL
ncbi:hypothetical protein [Streptacidiphilus neutrinimicus]|uniref:hypothetical protein n=1 Tax=Streptacidiphilus neutrinimicus TaxID=105420 RepID=UPI0005A76573|nr:hypothetical protein [Streptacidiphilus neutrinimicus]